jgi:hypothetical protein
MEMAAWLRELGLERYEPTFRENEIDSEVLPELTEADLEKIGLPLGARKKSDGPTKKPKEQEQPPVEAEAYDEAEGEEPEAEDASDESGEDASEGAVEDTEEPSEEPVYTVRVDGKEVQVTLSELTKGYSRESDYRRKTMALADERKALEAFQRQVAENQRHYAERLQELQALFPAEQEPDWQQLAAEDPSEYVRQKAIHEDRQKKLWQLRAA